jgi:ATP-binding cassette subfamily C protein LapB
MSPLAQLLDRAARLVGQRLVADRLDDLSRLVATKGAGCPAAVLLPEAWRAAGLAGDPIALRQPTATDLPFVGWREDLGWFLVTARSADGYWAMVAPDGMPMAYANIASLDRAQCFGLPHRDQGDQPAPRAIGLVWQAMLAQRHVFSDAVLATVLVNLLTLAGSLYSMQVYDRVIPNQGFQTLKVLTVGAIAAILLEFVLKQIRAAMVERACTEMDHNLSGWIFARMLGIRMDQRPASVGTLAAQVKGFEMVRGMLTSTSLFVLADVPFALAFLAVIAMVGGWVVLVPLFTLPVALVAGLVFQRAIERHARTNLVGNHQKTGLLVEAIDGAESLKANGAGWRFQTRWSRLAQATADAEQRVRHFSSSSQNLTALMQQLGYVALVATGAYLVSENQLTMGGLLACSIISNRAMMPIIQLPGMMVQWAHARAAMEGLDKIIALPGDDDDAPHGLTPGVLEGSLRFEHARFTYGLAKNRALALERLDIKAGERVGVVGAIGSGKSTLLKLASGLYRPMEGKSFLGGIDMALLAPAVLRETIGYVPQEVRLFSGTLRDNLLLGLPDPGDEVILAAARRTGLMDLISAQPRGLALPIHEGSRGVSGGQKQLIAITRLVLARPKIWLLDEPTGSLDALSEARVTALLKEESDAGATLLVATHKPGILPLLERVVVVHGGCVVLDGPRNVVMDKLANRISPTLTVVAATGAKG